jgi:hypothetical protein
VTADGGCPPTGCGTLAGIVHRLALLSFLAALLAATLGLAACKSDRAQLEQLVPDGATGLVSVDAKALAQTELDGDGVYSTYERAGAADENGVNAAAGLYIDREVE